MGKNNPVFFRAVQNIFIKKSKAYEIISARIILHRYLANPLTEPIMI